LIISGKYFPLTLKDRKIHLPPWLLAPLFLNRGGARFWAVSHEPEIILSNTTTEVVLTPIAPQHWEDVWRLEVTTKDRRGNLAKLYDILAESKIDVLFNEGSMHSFAKYNSMSFILSLIHYDNDGDGSKLARFAQQLPTVPGLETVILLRFLDQLVFDRAHGARFALNRLNLYRHMHGWSDRHQFSTLPDGSVLDDDHNLVLDDAFYEKLKRLGRSGNTKVWYTPAVDTHYRCIRILFFPANDNSPGHIQVSLAQPSTKALARVNAIVAEHGGNIIRSQLRPGLSKSSTDKPAIFGRLEGLSEFARRFAARYELTVEPVIRGESTRALLKSIEDTISRDKLLEECGVDITEEAEMIDG